MSSNLGRPTTKEIIEMDFSVDESFYEFMRQVTVKLAKQAQKQPNNPMTNK